MVLPHLGAAYNLARWLLRDDSGAEDVVQESFLRALKYFSGYHGGDSRAWLLTVVRNTSYNWLQQNRSRELMNPIDDNPEALSATTDANPETVLLPRIDHDLLSQPLSQLPI